MKAPLKFVVIFVLAALVLARIPAQPALAAALSWDPAANLSCSGGSGTWNSSNANWCNGTTDVVSNSNSDAWFGGTGGAVTVGTSLTAADLIFNGPGYNINGSTLTLGSGSVTMNASNGTISSVVAGSAGLTYSGIGTLNLSAVNTYSGTATVSSGTLLLNTNGDNNSGDGTIRTALNILPGAMVVLNQVDALGYNTNGTSVPTVSVTGATINNATAGNNAYTTNFYLTGGTMASSGGGTYNINSGSGYGITTCACSATSAVSSGITIRSGTLSLTVAQGTTPSGIDLLVTGPIIQSGGTFALSKSGAGCAVLTGSNTYSGATTITGGTLQIGLGGTGSLGGGAYSAAIANSGVLALSTSVNQTFSGVISGPGSLRQLGPGTLTLVAGGNTYHGATVVGGGVLALTGTADINDSSGITVSGPTAKFLQLSSVSSTPAVNLSQGTLDGTGAVGTVTVADLAANTVAAGGYPLAGGGTLSTGNVTFNGAATISLPNGSLLNLGILSVSNSGKTITVNASQPAWTSGGTVGLISYYSYDGQNFADFVMGTIGGLGTRQAAALANNAAARQIDLVITGNSTYWTGTQSSAWTTNPSVLNWELTPANTGTWYIEGDTPAFDDRAAGSTTVDVTAGNVHPASVTFGNLTKSYTLQSSGGFGIAGTAAVTISGGGTVTITNSNGYTGGTTLTSGDLVLNNNSALGAGRLTITGGSLDSTGGNVTLAGIAQSWSGSFAFVGNSPLNMGTGAVTLSASPTLYVNAGTLTVGGAIDGAGALIKNGNGTLVLAGSSNYTGGTILDSGVLVLNNNSALGSGTLTVNGGALDSAVAGVTLANNAQRWNAGYAFNGTQGLNLGAGQVTLGNNVTVTVNGNTLSVGGVISGSRSLTKAGQGVLALDAANAYTGGTTVNGGTLSLNYNNGVAGTLQGALTINPGGAVVAAVNNALGYGGPNWVRTININGGLLSTSASGDNGWGTTINMTGGTIASSLVAGYFSMGDNPVFAITGTNTPALISAGLSDRGDNGNPGIIFNVQRGAAASDLEVTGNISSSGSNDGIALVTGITLTGDGVTVLAGSDTYTGGTTVEGGTLIVQYPWSIDANGAGTNLSVGSSSSLERFGTAQPARHEAAAEAPEPGTFGLLAAALTAMAIVGPRVTWLSSAGRRVRAAAAAVWPPGKDRLAPAGHAPRRNRTAA